MAVIRVEKTEGFTVMSNCHLRDSRLSLKAIGLLSKMLSLPEDWDYTVAGLVSICKEGRDAISAALTELEGAGYVERCRTHNEAGHFDGVDYIVHEAPLTENPTMVPLTEKPLTENPITENPITENPLTENPQQINTKITKDLNIPPIVPQKEPAGKSRKRREPKSLPNHEPERFQAFWDAYPRGENKQGAIKAWDKLHADATLLRAMAIGLKNQMESDAWSERKYIPYASTWLNQRRWEDTPPKPVERIDRGGGWEDDRVVRYV